MSDSRSSSKRPLEITQQPLTATDVSGNKRTRIMDLFSQHQIETLQAELEHERNMRTMDQQRFEKAKKRLEKQVELAVDQAQEAQANLQQVQIESDRMIAELRLTGNNALEELRNFQLEAEDHATEQPDLAVWQEKCRFLEQRVATFENEEMKWKQELESIQKQFTGDIAKLSVPSPQKPPKILEEAPPTVMRELCRVRTQLSENERKERQANRKVDDLDRRNKALLQELEEARMSSRHAIHLEKELKETRVKYETLVAEDSAWKQFHREIVGLLKRQGITLCHDNGPPEVSTIIRYMERVQVELEKANRDASLRLAENTQLKEQADSARRRVGELEATIDKLAGEKRGLDVELEAAHRKSMELETKASIYLKESESLRALIKTFEAMPHGENVLASPRLDTSLKTMEVRLEALQRELAASIEDRNRLSALVEKATKGGQDDTLELARVREKFERLKEALYAERAKVEEAEARANHAEELAGRGAFNPETTRALRLEASPLTEALKEEIKVLRRQLEASGERKDGKVKSAHDPDKLNQRLKESFREQIALFREGVCLMTGLKVDMLPVTDGRPTFRVRSIYAENEHDHLMLRYPADVGDEIKSLDVLSTDFAKELFNMPHCHAYMTKFHSLPAFLASVQLALFEKQTVMM